MKSISFIKKFLCVLLILMLCFSYAGIAFADDYWYCPNCGHKNDSNYCPVCGTQKPTDLSSASSEIVIASGSCGTNVTWKLYSSGLLQISGSGDMQKSMSVSGTCPWEDYKDSILMVSIESGITSISEYAFYNCKKLKNVSLFGKIDLISLGAFYGCSSLEDVLFPSNEFEIDDFAFAYCTALKTIDMMYVTRIGPAAFRDCTNLTTVYIYDTYNLKAVDQYAFYNCSSLTKIDLGTEMSRIGGYAFSGCTSLEQVNMPDTIEVIALGAFSGCTALKQITIPAELPNCNNIAIENGAFSGCTALKKITFTCNEKVSIGQDAFKGVKATAYYPSTWTAKPSSSYYGGTFTWASQGTATPKTTPTPKPKSTPTPTPKPAATQKASWLSTYFKKWSLNTNGSIDTATDYNGIEWNYEYDSAGNFIDRWAEVGSPSWSYGNKITVNGFTTTPIVLDHQYSDVMSIEFGYAITKVNKGNPYGTFILYGRSVDSTRYQELGRINVEKNGNQFFGLDFNATDLYMLYLKPVSANGAYDYSSSFSILSMYLHSTEYLG